MDSHPIRIFLGIAVEGARQAVGQRRRQVASQAHPLLLHVGFVGLPWSLASGKTMPVPRRRLMNSTS